MSFDLETKNGAIACKYVISPDISLKYQQALHIPMKSICRPKTAFPSRANRPPYLNQGAKMAPSAMLLGND